MNNDKKTKDKKTNINNRNEKKKEKRKRKRKERETEETNEEEERQEKLDRDTVYKPQIYVHDTFMHLHICRYIAYITNTKALYMTVTYIFV